jgi:hypothetical protein
MKSVWRNLRPHLPRFDASPKLQGRNAFQPAWTRPRRLAVVLGGRTKGRTLFQEWPGRLCGHTERDRRVQL